MDLHPVLYLPAILILYHKKLLGVFRLWPAFLLFLFHALYTSCLPEIKKETEHLEKRDSYGIWNGKYFYFFLHFFKCFKITILLIVSTNELFVKRIILDRNFTIKLKEKVLSFGLTLFQEIKYNSGKKKELAI